MNTKRILLYYKYITVPNPQAIMTWQKELCQKLGLTGRIIIATEGINGTVCGSQEQTAAYIASMSAHELFGGIDWKDSIVNGSHEYFPKLQVRVKTEITNLGLDKETYAATNGAEHLTPAQWHEAIANADPEKTIIFDNRNAFEARVGSFKNAVIPDVEHFRDFPAYIDKHIDLFKDKDVLMYCTGGVRCERSSSYLIAKGISKKVSQLSGGIHRYAEQFPDGFFRGKNYVFDARITVPVTNDITGTCDVCNEHCDEFTNCLNAKCNKHFIGCPACIEQLKNTCSQTCHQLVTEAKVPKRPLRQRIDPTISQ